MLTNKKPAVIIFSEQRRSYKRVSTAYYCYCIGFKGVDLRLGYTKEDVIRLVQEEDVEFIRLQFTDIFGTLKNIAITACLLYTSPSPLDA